MINSISVDNFRSLCNINNIEVKPITVLLGKIVVEKVLF